MPLLSLKARKSRRKRQQIEEENQDWEVYKGRPPSPRLWTATDDKTICLCIHEGLTPYETWEVLIAADLYCKADDVEERVSYLRKHSSIGTNNISTVPKAALEAITYLKGGRLSKGIMQ